MPWLMTQHFPLIAIPTLCTMVIVPIVSENVKSPPVVYQPHLRCWLLYKLSISRCTFSYWLCLFSLLFLGSYFFQPTVSRKPILTARG